MKSSPFYAHWGLGDRPRVYFMGIVARNCKQIKSKCQSGGKTKEKRFARPGHFVQPCRGRRPRRPAEKATVKQKYGRIRCDFAQIDVILMHTAGPSRTPAPTLRCALTIKKTPEAFASGAFLCWRRPIFPVRCQTSIFGTGELNFRVRNGNGWTLTAKGTNSTAIRLSPEPLFKQGSYPEN